MSLLDIFRRPTKRLYQVHYNMSYTHSVHGVSNCVVHCVWAHSEAEAIELVKNGIVYRNFKAELQADHHSEGHPYCQGEGYDS